MLQKADIGEAAVYRRSVDRSRTFNGSGILFGMPDSILRFVRNRECTKRGGRFVGCRIFRRSGQGQIAADPLNCLLYTSDAADE